LRVCLSLFALFISLAGWQTAQLGQQMWRAKTEMARNGQNGCPAPGSHPDTHPHIGRDTHPLVSLGQTIEDLLSLGEFFGTANVQIRAEIYSHQKVV